MASAKLDAKKRQTPPTEKLLDGEQEARLIATRLGPPPKGYANWTLRLLARKVVELEIAPTMSRMTVSRTLKKNNMTNRKIQYWVIPPDSDAEFVACMEDVLETYAKPYDPKVPVLCMDEQPVQSIKDVKTPIAATREHSKRVDYEYERTRGHNCLKVATPIARK